MLARLRWRIQNLKRLVPAETRQVFATPLFDDKIDVDTVKKDKRSRRKTSVH